MAIDFDEREELILADMRSTYTETTIDHAMNPRNVGSIADADDFAMVIELARGKAVAAGSKHPEEGNQGLSSLQKRALEEGL